MSRRITPEQVDAMRALLDTGHSYKEIGQMLSIGQDTVRRKFPGRGHASHPRIEHTVIAQIEKLAGMGRSPESIAHELHISEHTVRKYGRAAGLIPEASRTQRLLSADDLAAADDLLKAGYSYAETARRIGVTGTAIARRFPNRGHYDPEEQKDQIVVDEIERLARIGRSTHAIALELGISAKTVSKYRDAAGLPSTRPSPTRMTDEMIAAAERMLNDGWPYAEIARELGVSATTLSQRFPGRGWTRKQVLEHIRFMREMEALIDLAAYAPRTKYGSSVYAPSGGYGEPARKRNRQYRGRFKATA